jgi:type II secretory pathway pseudopilin PulG
MRMRPKKKDKRKKAGYTMIEIMVVVGILMVIITMAIPTVSRTKRHAYETAALEGLRSIFEAEELYYDVSGYYTGGGDQFQDLRKIDAVDPGAYGASAGEGVFIKGYSIRFENIGEYAQNYSVRAVPIIRGMDLRTFYMMSDGIVRNDFGEPI